MKTSKKGAAIIQLPEPNTPAGRLTSSTDFLMESSAMRVHQLRRFARPLVAACVLALSSASGFAQSGPLRINVSTIEAAAAQAASQPPAETVRRLSMDDRGKSPRREKFMH